MTLGTTVSMGGTTPNVNYEIGQASTQALSIGDRAVRNLANVAATGAISMSSLQNKGSTVPTGVMVIGNNLVRIYGWIDSGGWGALAITFLNVNTNSDIQAIDVRGGTNLQFLSTGWYGHFLYGRVNTTGSAYTAAIAPLLAGNPSNWLNNVTYVGTNATRGEVYAYSNLYNNGIFLLSALNLTSSPTLWVYGNAQGFNFQVSFVEKGTIPSAAYMLRSGSATQKIGIISGINPGTTTPTIAYFAAQGTDTYRSLASAANAVFAGGAAGLANGWDPTGATRFAAPAVQVVGSGPCKVNSSGSVVFYTNNTSPFVHAWSFTGSAFGTKFANPASLPTSGAFQIFAHPSDKAVCFVTLGGLVIYAWDNVTGFGARFTNPTELTGRNFAAFFNRSF